jgi:endonuclease/exonuclease/phosphatase family metal-dependent hydrolase
MFLQEVQGVHRRHAGRYRDWPLKPQHEFIADKVWREVAYGRNATTRHGHHGNAVLSRFPIIEQANQDISAHAFESRGMLHCVMQLQRGLPPLHCINVHLGLFERGRLWQVRALCERIRESVPADAALIIAGYFNDWRRKADRTLQDELGVTEVLRRRADVRRARSRRSCQYSGSTAFMRGDSRSWPPMCTTPIRWRGCPTMRRSPQRST